MANWFRLDSDMVDHPKTYALETRLSDPRAGWYVIRLWAWMSRYAARGRLAPCHADAAERACNWRGAAGALLAEFVAVGWLEKHADGTLEAHDWWEKQSAFVLKAQKDAKRKRESRETRRADGAETARAVPRTGAVTARVTRRDETRRDETSIRSGAGQAPPPPSPAPTQAPKKPVAPPPTPDWQPTIDRLTAAFAELRGGAKYAFSGRDAAALRPLLLSLGPDEVLVRWRRALQHQGFPAVATLVELADKHGHFAGAGPHRDVTRGVASPSAQHVLGPIDTSRKAAP